MAPPNSAKRPLVDETIMCLTAKPTSLWAGSIAQVVVVAAGAPIVAVLLAVLVVVWSIVRCSSGLPTQVCATGRFRCGARPPSPRRSGWLTLCESLYIGY